MSTWAWKGYLGFYFLADAMIKLMSIKIQKPILYILYFKNKQS